MNVNPFSYLIEKLKGKVDKSGDTMTGQLRINNNSDTPLVIKKANTSIGKVYLGFENSAETIGYFSVGADKKPYFTSGNGADTPIALEKSNDALYGANPGTTVSSETFANGHKASEYKFIAIEMYWGSLSHSLDTKVIPAQAWIGTDAFKLINANGNVNLTVSNRTNTGFDIVANNGAVFAVIEGIY